MGRTCPGSAIIAEEHAGARPGARDREDEAHQLGKVQRVESDGREQALKALLHRDRHDLLVETKDDEGEYVTRKQLGVRRARRAHHKVP